MLCIWAFLMRDEKTVYNRLSAVYSGCHHRNERQASRKLDLDEKVVVVASAGPEHTEHAPTPNPVVAAEDVHKIVDEGVLRFYFCL
jgi:hypothetical protein